MRANRSERRGPVAGAGAKMAPFGVGRAIAEAGNGFATVENRDSFSGSRAGSG